MSDSLIDRESKDEFKTSKIKFKHSLSKANLSNISSAQTVSEKKSSALKSTLSVAKSYSEDISELLDPTSCYHPECSFAYNITGDIRNNSLITECLPFVTYQRLAVLWDLDPQKVPRAFGNTCKMQNTEEEDRKVEEFIRNVERELGIRSDISEDLEVNIHSARGTKVEIGANKNKGKENPYLKFFKKDEDMEVELKNKTNLRRKAKKITKLIIKNFLDWYQSLGGNDGEAMIDDFTLQELFQIGFDFPAAKALVIRIKEMPTVPGCLAVLRNEPKHSTRYGLRQLLKQDIKKESIPPKMFAFGSMLPKEKPSLRYKPPRNFVEKTWMECSRVPSELDTMKTIWVGLERLRSTIAFSNWLNKHPEIKPPAYLEQKGLLKINYEEWNQMFKGFELEVDTIEVLASDTKMIQEKTSVQDSKLSASSSGKFDSYESLL